MCCYKGLKDFNRKNAVYQKKIISFYHIFATGNDTKRQHHVKIYQKKSKVKRKENRGKNMELT